MTGKIIKKITRAIAYLLMVIILLPVVVIGIIQIPDVQNFVATKTLNWVADKLGTEIQFSSIHITTFNRIRINDLFITDQTGDTLLYAEKTRAVMPVIFSLMVNKDPVSNPLKRLDLEHSVINLSIDSTQTLNFQFILDYLQSGKKDSTKKSNPLKINRIHLIDSRFSLTLGENQIDTIGIDFSRMRLTHFNCNVTNFTVRGDTLALHIDPLSFIEASGFDLKELTGDMELCGSYIHFSDLIIQTPDTKIDANRIDMNFSKFKDFGSESLFKKVRFTIDLNESQIDFSDIGYFADFFNKYSQKIELMGNISGPLSNLKGKDLFIGWGSVSKLSGDFDINGLPDIQETFLYFYMKKLVTTSGDIVSLNLPGNNKLELPEFLKALENINYQGNFTGFLNDFVAHGKLSTNLGTVFTDLMFTPDTSSYISISGRVSTQNFQVGKLLDNDLIGDISMNMAVTGSYSKNTPLTANLNGKITQLMFKDYRYQNIQIDGVLSNKKFDGEISVNDPNLVMEFKGLIDMVAELPKYDFMVNIIDANLFALNISDADPEYHASFLLRANATGRNLDEMNGEFKLLNSLFSKTDKQIQIYGLNANVKNNADINEISVRSDLLDADISGHFAISKIKDHFMLFTHKYLPALFDDKLAGTDTTTDSRFNFDITFKKTQSFFEFFFPEYLIAENSQLVGTFNSDAANSLSLSLISPELKVSNNSLRGLVINIDTEDSALYAIVGSQTFNFNQRIDLENFTMESSVSEDKIAFKTRWLNWDSTLNKGSLSGNVIFHEKPHSSLFSLLINPSSITISDSLWNINRFALDYDTSAISVDSFRVEHKGQYLIANGTISDYVYDTLYFSFNNFDLANLNFFTRKSEIEFSGMLNGSGNLTGAKTNPLFFATLGIDNLVFNGEEFGNCTIESLWNNRKQSLSISAEAQRGQLTMLEVDGDYYPSKNGRMDFNIKLNKLKTNILNPFMEGIFSDFRGLISGELNLSGFGSSPNLSGNLKLYKNAFTVDYLNVRYNLTTEVEIVNNNFILNNVEIFDQEGNYGVLNGMVRTENLKDINLGLNIDIFNLLCLDTKETGNDMFFGTAYATGSVKIKGPPSTLSFDIDAQTNKNTQLFIPLSQTSEVSEYNYISFTRPDSSDTETEHPEEAQTVDLSGLQMNFNLDVTPDAEVQIIFDPTMGDIIKARGSGNIVMSISTLGTFYMVGEYTIEKGEYLFTLQDVINRRFKIDEGSTLRWTGDPLNAIIDITAVYRTKASLQDLGTNITQVAPNNQPPPSTAEASNRTVEPQNRVTVDCRIFLTGNLMSPDIRYDIYLPFSEEEVRNSVESKIQSEEELSKQFLSLLVMNRFMPSQGNESGDQGGEGYIAGVNNASELLSNQLSNWLSQISDDFDVGFTYRPGNQITTNEVEVILSTQLLNDKLSINGSLDMKSNAVAQNSGTILGDVDLDYKLSDKGKVRLKAFNHSNEQSLLEQSPYTQGVGIFYKEEFDTFGELIRRYWATLTGKNKKTKSNEPDTTKE